MRFDDPNDPTAPGSTDPTGAISPARAWYLGAFYPGNYPSAVTFHEDRLIFAGCPNLPQRLDGSVSGQYNTFSPNAVADGTVTAASAYAFSLNANTVNVIRWMQSDQHGLLIGTAGGEWLLSPGTTGQAISALNVSAKQSTLYGSEPVAPLRIGNETIFTQAGGRRLRALKYDFYVDGFQGPDVSVLSEHLTVSGFKQYALQKSPQQIIWAVRNDGALVSISYDRDQDEQGWYLHQLGGDPATTKVLSVACIPAPDDSRDEVWLAVQRVINGSTVCYVERMTKLWEVGDAVEYTVSGVTQTKYVPQDTYYLDSAVRTVFGSPVTTITGLTWLEGQTVSVLADSATHPDVVVTGGSITLQRQAQDVCIGLGYTSKSRTLQIEAGGADGPAQGKIKRIHRLIVRMYDTLGLTLRAGTQEQDVSFRYTNGLMDAPPSLFSGDQPLAWEGSYDRDGYVYWEQNQPLPSNISMIAAQLETQDGG